MYVEFYFNRSDLSDLSFNCRLIIFLLSFALSILIYSQFDKGIMWRRGVMGIFEF